jgi:hypothetical protein
MTQKRPINADTPAAVPKADQGQAPREASPEPGSPPNTSGSGPPDAGRRSKIPSALKAIAVLVVIAIVFLVAAIAGGGGSEQTSGSGTGESGSGETGVTTATNNTTRVSGADPATLAANVALTVFPSKTPAQRPKSVALVGEDSWQNAVAAAALMGPPIRAPMLVSGANELPSPTIRALEALQPHGNRLKPSGNDTTKGVPFYVIGAIPDPASMGRTARTGETSGAPQAAEIEIFRKSVFRAPPPHVIVAPENDPAFAVPAAAWVARSGDDVLYAHRDKLPPATVAALKSFPTPFVYVLGPPSVISPAVMREIAKVDKGLKRVKRVSGQTPAENAIALARYSDGSFGWNVNDPGHGFVIARSDAALNAALAAPLSASGTWGPLLLTESADKLPSAVREYLLDVKPGYTTDPTRAFYNHVWIIGNEDEIDANQQAEINELAELTKVGGKG